MAKTQSFPARPGALSPIREFVRTQAVEAALPDNVTRDVILAVSEACSNAVRHSASDALEVTWSACNGGVSVEVRDEGMFRRPAPGGNSEGGLGIQVMLGLMDELRIRGGRLGSPGTVVRLIKNAP